MGDAIGVVGCGKDVEDGAGVVGIIVVVAVAVFGRFH